MANEIIKRPLLTHGYSTASLILQQAKNMSLPENKAPIGPTAPQQAVKFRTVKFIHEKSPQFTTYHADGSWGAINADSEIYINFFAEFPQPSKGVISDVIPETGVYTGRHEFFPPDDPNYQVVIRDFQCSVAMSIKVAERLHALLTGFIKMAKDQAADQQARLQKK